MRLVLSAILPIGGVVIEVGIISNASSAATPSCRELGFEKTRIVSAERIRVAKLGGRIRAAKDSNEFGRFAISLSRGLREPFDRFGTIMRRRQVGKLVGESDVALPRVRTFDQAPHRQR